MLGFQSAPGLCAIALTRRPEMASKGKIPSVLTKSHIHPCSVPLCPEGQSQQWDPGAGQEWGSFFVLRHVLPGAQQSAEN